MWFYHEPLKSLLKEKMLILIKYMGLLRFQKKRILKLKVVTEAFPLDILKKKKVPNDIFCQYLSVKCALCSTKTSLFLRYNGLHPFRY